MFTDENAFDLDQVNGTNSRNDICVAIATPPGQSGLAVIRMSGPGAAALAEPLFAPASSRFQPVSQMTGYTCAAGYITDPADGSVIDQVVLTRFTAPRSFTGEDTIEISCHGGVAVKQSILALLIRHGARPAEPGEFTRRAFMNGKMDLTQAEAVMDLISADAARSAGNAAAQLKGLLSQLVRQDITEIYNLLASLELVLEFPEHDESDLAADQLCRGLRPVYERLARRIAGYEQGRLLREGLTVVLAGRPNVGKSSLLNALSGYDRAIVTAVPGTTRDTVEELIDVQGIPVRLIDTAGLRDTTDVVEQIGVSRARQAMEQADLIFWMISPEEDLEADLPPDLNERTHPALILLISKDDLNTSMVLRQKVQAKWPDRLVMTCSAVTGEGLIRIRDRIVSEYESHGLDRQEDVLITSSRHRHCLDKAAQAIRQAESGLRNGLTLDVAAMLLRRALEALAELTGDQVTETLIDTIFSRFCVGK